MMYRESKLQQRCVAWFRREYPEWANLFFHVRNENSGGEKAGGRAVAEGVTAGVADLMLQVPNDFYTGLAIEMKVKGGSQKQMQKWYQQFYEMAGGRYVVVKDFDTFTAEVEEYMEGVSQEKSRMAKELLVKMEIEIEKKKEEKRLRDERKALKKLAELKEASGRATGNEAEGVHELKEASGRATGNEAEARLRERNRKETEKARKRLAKLLGCSR